jgi:inner membrane transporter RhtA
VAAEADTCGASDHRHLRRGHVRNEPLLLHRPRDRAARNRRGGRVHGAIGGGGDRVASRRAVDFVWAALAAAGIILILPIFRASAPVDLHGILWALLAGACWGAYILLGQRAGASVHGGTATALGMATGALCVLPFGVAVVGKPLLNPAILPIGIGVAILSGAFPYSLEMFGLQRLPAHTFGVLMSVEPALGAVIGRILLHEKLALLQIVAIACVIAASAGSTLSSRPQSEAAKS